MSIIWIATSLLLFANILLAFLLIFIERRDPASTWAWLMVLIIMPGVGFILYLILGQNLSKKKMFNLKIEKDIVQKKLLKAKQEFNPPAKKYHELIVMNYRNGQSILSQNNDVKIYTNGNEKFDALIDKIENSKTFIHMVYYIINPDELGNKILDVLTKKALEGIEVKLLYDAMGGRKLPKHFFDKLINAGGKVACFFPALIPHVNIRINFRNHRKIAVIDGIIGFVGGLNIGDEYLGKNKNFGYWRDTHLKIEGDAVDDLEMRFLLDWAYASNEEIIYQKKYFPNKISNGTVDIQIVSSGPDSTNEQIKHGYLKIINSAKKSIFIQSPYFIPDGSIFEALKVAALSGVDVKIMIPCKPDHPFVYWASYSYAGELLKYGVKIFTYENGFIHSKIIIADGEVASVGTANMDIRSFKLNFEVNAFLYDSKTAKILQAIFKKDSLVSKELTEELYKNRSLLIKFKESISRLLSPIL